MDSVEKRITRILEERGRGKVYFPSDFFECGSDKAVSKALQRLVQSDVLMRMERGLYCYPEIDTMWGMGRLPASSDVVLEAISQREGFKVGPCPGEAHNALGLSEQVVTGSTSTKASARLSSTMSPRKCSPTSPGSSCWLSSPLMISARKTCGSSMWRP